MYQVSTDYDSYLNVSYLLHSKSEHYNVPAHLNRKVESDNVIDKLLSDFKATKEADFCLEEIWRKEADFHLEEISRSHLVSPHDA